MTKKIVLFAVLCLFALSLNTASAISAEYQTVRKTVQTKGSLKASDIAILQPKKVQKSILAKKPKVDPCPRGCHGK